MALNDNRILIDSAYIRDWIRYISDNGEVADDVEFEVDCPICGQLMCGPGEPGDLHNYVILPCGHMFGYEVSYFLLLSILSF